MERVRKAGLGLTVHIAEVKLRFSLYVYCATLTVPVCEDERCSGYVGDSGMASSSLGPCHIPR